MDGAEPSPPKDTEMEPEMDSSALLDDEGPQVEITIKFPGEKLNQPWHFSPNETFEDLITTLSLEFPSYDWDKSKALVEKRRPGLKSIYTPSEDSQLPLSHLHTNTLRLLVPKTSSLASLQNAATAAAERAKLPAPSAMHRRMKLLTPSQRRAARNEAIYTFHTLRPLPHLPNPHKSHALLARLKADPGIQHVMHKHQFSVALLTEMDPASHTSASHSGVTRILGLNRNRGEVIELRLRTDAYDGYRAYSSIRKTLCHELAHNVHSSHDKHFWELCKQIEREVERADYNKSGRTVGDEEYAPARGEEEEEGEMDEGGWEGGTYVLGGEAAGGEGLSQREIRARAAEARWARLDEVTRDDYERAKRERRERGGDAKGDGVEEKRE